ncbi:MAG: SpoIIE family protein phosphatase [Bacteroidetes bacterium]|nr:SpoIIE family protein phosphatase [Bacteroidota bacterium]
MAKYFLYITCCLVFSITAWGQTFNFKNYNTEQGLPQSQVLSITQDSKGNMWFGTNSGGVGKFDGNKFTTYTDNDGLVNNVVFSILEARDKRMVFGTNRGISVYNGFYFKNYTEKQGLKNSRVFKVIETDDNIWIGTEQGVYTFKNDKIQPFTEDTILNNSSVYTMFVDAQKRIWFGTFQSGAVCYNPANHSFKHYTTDNGLAENWVFSIGQTIAGDILVGARTNGLSIIDPAGKVRKCDYIPRQENVSFSCILTNSKNEQWFGTYAEGVIKYADNAVVKYNLKNGLTNNAILCMYTDREKNIWIGTDGSGVYKYSGERFVSYTKENGLPESYVNALAQDKKGNVWIALRSMGLIRMNGGVMSNFKFKPNTLNTIPDNDINAICLGRNGIVWFGSKDGLCSYENEQFTIFKDPGFRHKYILSLYEDSDGILWIGTNDGFYKLSNNQITEIKLKEGAKSEVGTTPVLSITEDKFGHLWLGTEDGAIEYDGEKPIAHNSGNGFVNKRVLTIITDHNKNLWLGTEEGLYNYNYSSFSKLSQKNGLISNAILFLITDQNKNLFIGTNNGIDKLDLNSYYNHSISIKHFGMDDGLVGLECNANACMKDNLGRLWFGTINGVEIYNPKEDFFNAQEPVTRINNLKLFFSTDELTKYVTETDSASKLPKDLVLSYNKNHLTFEYVGVSHVNPEKVRYQFKLEGIDNDWSPPTSKTEITYPSLPAGKYTFMVKAMNNDGVWNIEPVTYSFQILPPWYNTWWFYSICAVVLVASIWYYNYHKTKKLMEDKQKLENEVNLRTRELREEKEKVETINKEVISQKAIIEHKNTEITDSIKYAKNIQEALLPSMNDIHKAYHDIFILYMPKDIVSGDFYWFARRNNMKYLAAVDCTGHGVPGAFMSIVGNTLLNEIVNEKNITNPGDILLELHKGVKEALNQSNQEFERRDGMDIALCAIEENNRVLHFSGANRPLWIFRKSDPEKPEIIKPNKFPIGGAEFEKSRIYESQTITVEEGDCVYMFSDGYADQFGGPKGKKFMLANLQRAIAAIINLPIDEQKQKLYESFVSWKEDNEQVDDVLVIGLKI